MKVICNAGKKRDISPPLLSARLRFSRGADEEKGLLKQCMKSLGGSTKLTRLWVHSRPFSINARLNARSYARYWRIISKSSYH